MSITFERAYKTSDGQVWPTLELAQRHELKCCFVDNTKDWGTISEQELLDAMLSHKEEVINILTTKGNSRPKGRKANGHLRRKPADLSERG